MAPVDGSKKLTSLLYKVHNFIKFKVGFYDLE